MRRVFAGLAALLICAGMHVTPEVQLRQAEMLNPTVRVELEASSGSGTVLRSDEVGTYIVTNAHVAQKLGATEHVTFWILDSEGHNAQGMKQEVRVVAIDDKLDLALLKVTDPDFRAPAVARMANDDVDLTPAEDVWVAGAALGLRVHLTQGLLSIVSQMLMLSGGPLPHIVTSAPVIMGNSGGGLYHRSIAGHFEYIGTVQAVANVMDSPITTTNYAIPNATLRGFLAVKSYGWLIGGSYGHTAAH